MASIPSSNQQQQQQQQQQQDEDVDEESSSTTSNDSSSCSVNEQPSLTSQPEDENSPEKERQLLLLMLLAQVCALHDPSPKTFTVHVLELFERGILDRESICFLFELGLVPLNSSASLLLQEGDASNQELFAALTKDATQENALVTVAPTTTEQVRAQEASAIRWHLEQSSHSPAWAVEHHPLSLSRYQREFHQVRLLNRGAFGHVFHVTCKLDQMDYAIKRVAFSVKAFQSHKISQAIREVMCLAQCSHEHCVRYYTAWLEPSWMTGSSSSSTAENTMPQHLLTMQAVSGMSRRASFTYGSQDVSSDYSSEFAQHSQDDSCVGTTSEIAPPHYRYEIFLFIQMQLCTCSTLADWIAQRNVRETKLRAVTEIQIFTQLLQGLAHVHSRGIVHRDLKPANVFISQQGHFLIGDFGLSRLLRNANHGRDFLETDEVMTTGIGTASYAAPEQVTCHTYGPEVDIFSLGLILLELFCIFGTEHERIDTFQDCRTSQTLPKWLSQEYPEVASIIRKCTHPNPSKRPTAADLCANVVTEQDLLRLQLHEKDQELQMQRSELDKKDRIIQELKSQVKRLSMEQHDKGGDDVDAMLAVGQGVMEAKSVCDADDHDDDDDDDY